MTGESAGVETFDGVLKWRVRANWKFVAENFLGDCTHAATSHAECRGGGYRSVRRDREPTRNDLGRVVQAPGPAALHFVHSARHGATDAADEERASTIFDGQPPSHRILRRTG